MLTRAALGFEWRQTVSCSISTLRPAIFFNHVFGEMTRRSRVVEPQADAKCRGQSWQAN